MAKDREQEKFVVPKGYELVPRSKNLPAVVEKERQKKSRSTLGRGALGSLNIAWGTGKFFVEAFRNTKKGHINKGILATLAISVAWIGDENAPEVDNCTNVLQERVITGNVAGSSPIDQGDALKVKNGLRTIADVATFGWGPANDNRSLGDIAEDLSNKRGYYIPEERLAALNNIFEKDADGNIKTGVPVSWLEGKVLCMKVPGPIYKGYDIIDEKHVTLARIADDTKVNILDLREWNPELGKLDEDEEIAIGTLVQTEASVDNTLTLRAMTDDDGSFLEVIKRNPGLKDRILLANASLIGTGATPDAPGEVGYFPLVGGHIEDDKPKITPDSIRKSFSPDGVPIDVAGSQIRPEDKTKPPKTKPKPPKGKEKTPEKPSPKEIKIHTDHLKPEQASIAHIIVNTAYSLDISDKDKKKAAEIGLITALVESQMKNVKYGDRDSLGVFQQRRGWGTAAQRMNVQWATKAFYTGGSNGYSEPGLLDIKNWEDMASGDAAQAVQVSGFPDRYGERLAEARRILNG